MSEIERILWSTICEVAGEKNSESLVLGESRKVLRTAVERFAAKLHKPANLPKESLRELAGELYYAFNRIHQHSR